MRLIRRPWVWFVRFRKRKGYGVHSPFAFSFITTVLNERTPFYAYQSLSRLHPWWVRWPRLYPIQCRRLLFRLANFAEAQTICVLGELPLETEYMQRARVHARIIKQGVADLVLVAANRLSEAPAIAQQMPEKGMMVLEGIHKSHEANHIWRAVQQDAHTGITFDCYTYGVAFFNHHLHKQHYRVNF